MTSKPVAQLLVDLGVDRSHSRPHVSNDNPYSEANFKTLKYCPAFPGRFGSIDDAAPSAPCSSTTTTTRHSGLGLHTAASVHYGTATEVRGTACRHPRRQPRPVPVPTARTAQTAHRRMDQPTDPRSTHKSA
jgi:putative transposase